MVNEKYRLGEVRQKFREIWGYEDFRAPQGEIVSTILNGKDALIVLPTGRGKSICFQLPALLQNGLTLVISPLVALMENQINQLNKLGLSGALLHSELPRQDRQHILQAINQQKFNLVYLSPETLLSIPVWTIISQPQIKIKGIILDEVHCLTQWGTTFRPAYRRLGVVRESLLKQKPPRTKIAIAAFTATADPQAQTEIIKTLNLNQPEIFLISPYRSNLKLNIQMSWTPKSRRQKTLKFIQTRKNQSGLVYVRSRKDSESLAQWFKSHNYPTAAYHAGVITNQRRKIEQEWLANKIQFVICTSAFGMGIDKPDVRWIIHYHPPELIAEYVQEVGRAGRDGKLATTLTLISEPTGILDPTDKQRSKFFTHKLQQQYRYAQQLFNQLPPHATIASIQEKFPQGEISLSILHSLGLVTWQDPFSYHKHLAKVQTNCSFSQSKYYQQQMQQYLYTNKCRWQYLLQSFGFKQEAQGFKCGNCDNCQKSQR